MKMPNIIYNPSIDLPRDPSKSEAAQYKGQMAMKAFALVPVVGRVASFTSGYLQLKALNSQLAAAEGWQDRVLTMGSMAKTAGLIGVSVLSPTAGAVASGFLGSFSHMSEFISHMGKGEVPSAALDAFRMGTSVVYMWAMISGNPVYIALSLVAQGSEDIVEGASMLIKQWDEKEKDWTVIGLAGLQMGLGGLRGYQGASIGANYAMERMHKPETNHLKNMSKDTGDLTQEQLDVVNKDFEHETDRKITHVKLGESGQVVYAEFTSDESWQTGKSQIDFKSPDEMTLDFETNYTDAEIVAAYPQDHPLITKFKRPEGFMWPNGRLGWEVLSVDAVAEVQGDHVLAIAHVVIDDSWYIRDIQSELSLGIHKSLAGENKMAQEHFGYYQDLYSDGWCI